MATAKLDLSFLGQRASQRRMALTWLGVLALGLAWALLAPRWYLSGLVVVPARPARAAGLSSLLGGELAGLAGGLESGAGGGAEPARIVAVLQSNSVSDAVIEKFDLKTRFGDRYVEEVREELWRRCAVKALTKPGLVQVSCEDKDPAFAQEMLGFLVEVGNQVFRRVSVGSATEEARFLEGRVAQLRAQADASSQRMREFQERHGIVDLDTQARSVVSALAGLQSQRLGKQLELEYARTYSSEDETSIRQLESQVAVMSRKLRSLETPAPAPAGGAPREPASTGIFPVALDVPRLRAEFEKLYRDRKVSEASLVVALERLENAKANEARDVSTFLVLDPPNLPAKPVRPRLGLSLAVAAVLGLLCALAQEWVRSGGLAQLRGPGRSTSDDHGGAPPAARGA